MRIASIAPDAALLPDSRQHQFRTELESILQFWMDYVYDAGSSSFVGSVDWKNQRQPDLPRGTVMLARICWAFSTAALHFPNKKYREMADRSFECLFSKGWDQQWEGVYWSIKADGSVLEDKKQIYAQAFAIYAAVAYYELCHNQEALAYANKLWGLIEKFSRDPLYDGYFEAFTREWNAADDLRLSLKEPNDPKTANTHLHVVEAYAALYRVAPSAELRKQIANLLRLFDRYFIAPTGALRLFFSRDWKSRSELRSYGHEIEAAWLLLDCAKIIGDNKWISVFEAHCLDLASAAMEAWDDDGALWYEFDPDDAGLVREKHSWPQAEALIAFGKIWELTGDNKWLKNADKCWQFIQTHLRDEQAGEWYWGVFENYQPMPLDKAGFWKCPYHSTRALVEWLLILDRKNNEDEGVS